MFSSERNTAAISPSGIMFGPSLMALSGCGCDRSSRPQSPLVPPVVCRSGAAYSVTFTQRIAFISNRGSDPGGSNRTGTRRFSAD